MQFQWCKVSWCAIPHTYTLPHIPDTTAHWPTHNTTFIIKKLSIFLVKEDKTKKLFSSLPCDGRPVDLTGPIQLNFNIKVSLSVCFYTTTQANISIVKKENSEFELNENINNLLLISLHTMYWHAMQADCWVEGVNLHFLRCYCFYSFICDHWCYTTYSKLKKEKRHQSFPVCSNLLPNVMMWSLNDILVFILSQNIFTSPLQNMSVCKFCIILSYAFAKTFKGSILSDKVKVL